MPGTPSPIQVAPMHAATSTGVVGDVRRGVPVHERDAVGDAELGGPRLAAAMKTVLMSTPVPRTPWSRAQVQSISPVPLARSSIVVPAPQAQAPPRMASLRR